MKRTSRGCRIAEARGLFAALSGWSEHEEELVYFSFDPLRTDGGACGLFVAVEENHNGVGEYHLYYEEDCFRCYSVWELERLVRWAVKAWAETRGSIYS